MKKHKCNCNKHYVADGEPPISITNKIMGIAIAACIAIYVVLRIKGI